MNPINLGGGTVLFENAIDIPQESLISYLEKEKDKWRAENFDIVYGEDGKPVHAVNKGGFIYSIESMNASPVRIQELEHSFFQKCDEAVYEALLHYIEIFPAILQCLWWRSGGHVLCYDEGANLGFHCDNDVNYRYGAAPQKEHATRNVLSALVYFNDCTEDDVPYAFTGGNMTIPYFDIDIKPKTGSILLMPANYLGAHEIHQVTSGSRYSYLSWFAQGTGTTDSGIAPMIHDGTYRSGGQWWMETIIEDFGNHLSEKYGENIPCELSAYRNRSDDHKGY